MGFDVIKRRVLRELLEKRATVYNFITTLFISIIGLRHLLDQLKVTEVILIPKPGKSAEEVTSYRTISLLPISLKVFDHS